MSRISAPPTPQSGPKSPHIPHEKIAMRAYEKWCKRGCPQGTDVQDWMEAESELRAEMVRMASPQLRR
jgi:hypothetical protein